MYLLVSVMCPKSSAERITREVLKRRLAACVTTMDGVHSTYWWKGRLDSGEESLLLIKTRSELFDRLKRTVKRIHPYEIPEVVAFRVDRGNREYLDWISKETEPTVGRSR
jgi:periplasmic divalent cation tolerance protein